MVQGHALFSSEGQGATCFTSLVGMEVGGQSVQPGAKDKPTNEMTWQRGGRSLQTPCCFMDAAKCRELVPKPGL